MTGDLLRPDDRPDPQVQFRADLAAYLRGLSGPELADLLARLPDPVKVDLIAELATRGPAYARLPPPGRSTRTVLAHHPAPLTDWLTNRPNVTLPTRGPAATQRRGQALLGRTAERDERAAMAWDDPGCPREPEPPAQGCQDWWLPDDR